MSYYNQSFINKVGDIDLYKEYFQNNYHSPFPPNTSYTNSIKFFAFQHYLVKCVETGRVTHLCRTYLEEMYQKILQRPDQYLNSPLLNRQIIEKVYGSKADVIIQRLNKYFDGHNAFRLYQVSRNRSLTTSEKHQLYSYFVRKLNTDNTSLQAVIENEIRNIINSNKTVKELSSIELKLYCQYIANTTETKPIIIIGIDEQNLRGKEDDNIVYINRDTSSDISILTKTVFHECKHAVQEKECKNKDSDTGFEMAQFILFNTYLNTKNYNSYHENYQFSSIELDAERQGYYDARLFLYQKGRRDLYHKLRDDRKKNLEKRDYYSAMINHDKACIPVDQYIVGNMDKIIQNHPEEIKKYPSLKHFYYDDGRKKSYQTILKQWIKEINKDMYGYYVEYGLRSDELNKIDLNKLSREEITGITSKLTSLYRFNKVCRVNDYLKDTETYSSKRNERMYKRIAVTTKYTLAQATKILSFIDKNFDILVTAYGDSYDNRLSNTHPLYDFLYDFRDFDPTMIKNEVLKENEAFRSKLDSYLDIYNNVLKKFNKKYVEQRLNRMPDQEKKKITMNDGTQLTLVDYMMKYIVPNMNSHQQIKTNDKYIYVSDILYNISKEVKNNSNDQSLLNNQELKDMFLETKDDIIEKNTKVI